MDNLVCLCLTVLSGSSTAVSGMVSLYSAVARFGAIPLTSMTMVTLSFGIRQTVNEPLARQPYQPLKGLSLGKSAEFFPLLGRLVRLQVGRISVHSSLKRRMYVRFLLDMPTNNILDLPNQCRACFINKAYWSMQVWLICD